MSVPVGPYRWGTYNWDFVDSLLSQVSLRQAYDRWKLATTEFFLDPQDLQIEAALLRRHRLSRQRVRSLFFSVCTNNIGVLAPDHMSLRSYGLFEFMSRSNHSCLPTARLEFAGADNAMALVARRDISEGEPVTWCYFREGEFLGAPYVERNLGLVNNFRFACHCSRCQAEMPAPLRGHKNLMAYFDDHIRQAARALSATPEGLSQIVESTPMVQHRRALGLAPGLVISRGGSAGR